MAKGREWRFGKARIGGRDAYRLDVPAGVSIDEAAEAALRRANDRSLGCPPVAFSFNGVKIVAGAGDEAGALCRRYLSELEERGRKWRESPEGVEWERAEAERRAADVARHARCMAELPDAAQDMDRLVDWLAEYSEVADRIHVDADFAAVLAALGAAGYAGDAHVGRPEEDFADTDVMGEYIVGQAISCMLRGMPPYPNTIKGFAREYREARAARAGLSDPKP